MQHTTILYRPAGPEELKLIEASGYTAFPPRLEWQPIASTWNVKESGSGFVTRFAVDTAYVSKFEVQNVGGFIHNELWVPAEELAEFNAHIVGLIEVTQSYFAGDAAP
jgi:hypothetical protein